MYAWINTNIGGKRTSNRCETKVIVSISLDYCHIWIWGLDDKESWRKRNWSFLLKINWKDKRTNESKVKELKVKCQLLGKIKKHKPGADPAISKGGSLKWKQEDLQEDGGEGTWGRCTLGFGCSLSRSWSSTMPQEWSLTGKIIEGMEWCIFSYNESIMATYFCKQHPI